MNVSVFAGVYVICAAMALYIRLAFMVFIGERKAAASSIADKLLVFLIVASMVAPLAYILTPVLDFANYDLPGVFAWLGILLIIVSLILLWRSHADLGANFALTPGVHGEQSLIKHGVYRYVRHPMYSSLWLWAFSMPLLLPNAVAGGIFLVVFISFYFLRAPLEESLMLDKFGIEYRDYMECTGRLFPKIRR
ncbi:MAG: isoprenylcysteine carboxylmethyltransferase family protein [Methanomassiliicoccales archaeon]|nr:isoprenylcysteine carboxylmethyltransferase family protein [Methanomassiliicoccales archaeon]